MKVKTKIFGEIEIAEDKKIYFANGIIGFPELKEFTLVHDEEKGTASSIKWLQSLDEPGFAMPVVDPLFFKKDYNPQVEEELLSPLGDFNPKNMLVLVTMSVPSDLKKMSINLSAPVVIQTETKKACQIILEESEYPVKFPVYEILEAAKKAGE